MCARLAEMNQPKIPRASEFKIRDCFTTRTQFSHNSAKNVEEIHSQSFTNSIRSARSRSLMNSFSACFHLLDIHTWLSACVGRKYCELLSRNINFFVLMRSLIFRSSWCFQYVHYWNVLNFDSDIFQLVGNLTELFFEAISMLNSNINTREKQVLVVLKISRFETFNQKEKRTRQTEPDHLRWKKKYGEKPSDVKFR